MWQYNILKFWFLVFFTWILGDIIIFKIVFGIFHGFNDMDHIPGTLNIINYVVWEFSWNMSKQTIKCNISLFRPNTTPIYGVTPSKITNCVFIVYMLVLLVLLFLLLLFFSLETLLLLLSSYIFLSFPVHSVSVHRLIFTPVFVASFMFFVIRYLYRCFYPCG